MIINKKGPKSRDGNGRFACKLFIECSIMTSLVFGMWLIISYSYKWLLPKCNWVNNAVSACKSNSLVTQQSKYYYYFFKLGSVYIVKYVHSSWTDNKNDIF